MVVGVSKAPDEPDAVTSSPQGSGTRASTATRPAPSGTRDDVPAADPGSSGGPAPEPATAGGPEPEPGATSTATEPGAPAGPAGRGAARRYDALAAGTYLFCAVAVLVHLWADPLHRAISHNPSDQALFEWLLAYAAHSVTHLANPLWTGLLNAPLGVNLAVNTSIIVPGVLLAPVTLTLGAPVTFLLVLTLNLAATGFAWYAMLSRTIVRSRAVALFGGLFCAFGPAMITHANSHLNLTAQYVLPLIIWRVLKLGEGRPARNGLILAALVVWQYSLSSELLFFTALVCAVIIAVYAVARPGLVRQRVPLGMASLGIAAVVTGTALAYPLWLMFAGPQTYHGTGFSQVTHAEDLQGFTAYPRQSLAGYHGAWRMLTANLTEENSFLGYGLVILLVVIVVVLRRRLLVWALAAVAVVFAVLSLGPRLRVDHVATGVPMPYALVADLPLFNAALPSRLAMVLTPVAGVLLALLLDRPGRSRRARWLWIGAVAVAVLPLVPPPLPVIVRAPVPRFISSGDWHRYVSPGGTLVPVPPTSDHFPDGQRWQTAARFGFAIPAGFFLGPGGPDGRGQIGPVARPTDRLLTLVARTGANPMISDGDREQARRDLAYWHAQVVVLSDGGRGSAWTPRHSALLRTLTELLGPPQRVDDVWLWPVAKTAG